MGSKKWTFTLVKLMLRNSSHDFYPIFTVFVQQLYIIQKLNYLKSLTDISVTTHLPQTDAKCTFQYKKVLDHSLTASPLIPPYHAALETVLPTRYPAVSPSQIVTDPNLTVNILYFYN